MSELPAEQRHRDAAAHLMPFNTIAEGNRMMDVKRGDRDNDTFVQAFARFERDNNLVPADQWARYFPGRVAEVVAEGDGFWRACSGCQESNEGVVSTDLYPYSETLRCQPGSGCGECGGIGAVWDDTDYSEMVRAMLANSGTGEQSPTIQDKVRELVRQEVINSPETADFMAAVPLEAAHQRERWGSEHDAGKTPFDWFWLIGYLAQKAADAQIRGDVEKAKHHTVSTAAALANWHAQISGKTNMRPGIGPGNGGDSPGTANSMAQALSNISEARNDD